MKYEEIEARAMRALRKWRRDKKRKPEESETGEVQRMYAAARQSRLTSDWTTATTSADAEIRSSLTSLRARCRALGRDSAYAKRAKTVVVNNVVGAGIGLQAQVRSSRSKFRAPVNKSIEDAWKRWSRADACHTGGALTFSNLERVLMDEVFDAGEVFVRMHFDAFGNSDIPFALELIESERVPHTVQPVGVGTADSVRMGIDVDQYYRPLAYWVRDHHPSEFHYPNGTAGAERIRQIDASEIIHLRLINRWPQTRGVPWLHAVAKKLNDMDGYSEAEIVSARGAANYMGTIETDPVSQLGTEQEDGTREIEVSPGLFLRLNPGEKFNFHSPNRPNAALDPFMRYMLRETAAGVGVSYESLSRDYSQSNYSSSRLALLDDRDTWRVLQTWFIESFRELIHAKWLQQAVLARAVPEVSVAEYATNPEKFAAVKFKPRGWSWVDPTKEVDAYKEAERAGYLTKTQIIAQTANGQDLEDVLDERKQELEQIQERGLSFDTDKPEAGPKDLPPPPSDPEDDEKDEDDEMERQMRLVR